jgi:hypothetical protein
VVSTHVIPRSPADHPADVGLITAMSRSAAIGPIAATYWETQNSIAGTLPSTYWVPSLGASPSQ